MHGGLKNHRYGCDTRGSHVGKKDEGNWGIWISYHGSGNVTHWYETEAERDRNWTLFNRGNNMFNIKKMKKKKKKR